MPNHEHNPVPGEQAVHSDATEPAAPIPPMSASLMARLWVVPAIVVCVMLAVAGVVIMFGAPALGQQQSVAKLLEVLNQDDGRRTLDIAMMPNSKEVWQAAQELAKRLQDRDRALKPEEIQKTADTLVSILDRFAPGRDEKDTGMNREHFLMLALARTGVPTAVPSVARRLSDPNARTRMMALMALAEMKDVAEARATLPEVLPLLQDKDSAVTIVACAAVASLADPGDAVAVSALADRLEADRELQWNAAMALARLGSSRGRMVLMNMLDRSFWEKIDLDYMDGGTQVRRKFSPAEVARYLAAAVQAAGRLKDAELGALIDALEKDPSIEVREAVREAKARRTATTQGAMGRAIELAGTRV